MIYGAVQIERGEFNEAAVALQMALSIRGGAESPIHDEWYLHGRLAEALGFLDDARAAYAKVPLPQAAAQPTFYPLAQRRLSALEQPNRPD